MLGFCHIRIFASQIKVRKQPEADNLSIKVISQGLYCSIIDNRLVILETKHNMQGPESMLKVPVVWRGNKYDLEMNSSASLKELGDELQKLTDVKAETMRLIVPQFSNKGSKLLSPFSDEHSCLSLRETLILEGKSIRMMGVFEDEVDRVLQDARTDLRIAGFDEEERRLKQRMSYRSHATLKLPQGPYIFCDFRTLQIPGLELNPPASEALKRMHMLAADPGIVCIMNKHRWQVGIMTEMAPVGYVGVSPKCILGFNKNHGEEISLRLRTDDLKGFRKYESIKKTLLHELAHMVYSEHDENFYALDKKLNEEAATLDWTKSRGHTLSGIGHSAIYEDDYHFEDSKNPSQKLGGNKSDQQASARASSVAAAYRRLANASDNDVGESEVHDKPNSDDSGFDICVEPNNINLTEYEDTESLKRARWKIDHEPDPDDHSGNQNRFEPDPDDSEPHDVLEPDPDDSGAFLKSSNVSGPEHHSEVEVIDRRFQPDTAADEPDPDDNIEAELNNPRHLNMERSGEGHSMIIETKKDQAHTEPDPDESQANGYAQTEPDPDDTLVKPVGISSMEIDEPDPDDQELRRIQDSVTVVCSRLQKAIEMLRAEVNPTEAATVLQTLFKIIRNVIEHPDEMKFQRLRKANPIIQQNIVNYKAAMEILFVIGFIEDVSDEIGKDETYLVLKRNDPGLLWLAKSSLETSY